jgi:hypothetical protein
MTLSFRNHAIAVVAALLCAFVTVGASIAPAIQPVAINSTVA